MSEERRYYSERMGIPRGPITLSALRRLIKIFYEEYKERHYFQGAFGFICVDQGYVPGTRGIDMEEHLFRTFGGMEIWPIEENYESFNEATCFDLIEYFYDNVGSPTRTSYHSWNNCGLHVYEADFEVGKREFREEINRHLARYESGYELMPNGEIFIRTPETLRPIIVEPPTSGDQENIDNRVNRAVTKFLHHSSTIDDKKDAIRNLANVLEFIRNDINMHMFPRDERRLFEIANRFGIRHHNLEQRTDFDENIWLEWIFYSYLNTINTIIRINVRVNI